MNTTYEAFLTYLKEQVDKSKEYRETKSDFDFKKKINSIPSDTLKNFLDSLNRKGDFNEVFSGMSADVSIWDEKTKKSIRNLINFIKRGDKSSKSKLSDYKTAWINSSKNNVDKLEKIKENLSLKLENQIKTSQAVSEEEIAKKKEIEKHYEDAKAVIESDILAQQKESDEVSSWTDLIILITDKLDSSKVSLETITKVSPEFMSILNENAVNNNKGNASSWIYFSYLLLLVWTGILGYFTWKEISKRKEGKEEEVLEIKEKR